MSKVVITAAVNGNRMDTDGIHIPVSPEEIAADALRCQDAGAAVVHFHARDVKTRRSTAEVAVFGDTIARIRAKSDLLIETTTGVGPKIDPATGKPFVDPVSGGILRPSDDDRLALIDIDPPQDLGSCAAGSLNMHNPVYPNPSVFPNSPYYIDESVKRMQKKEKLGFQFEVFDLGFLGNIKRLIDQGTLDRANKRWWVNYILGFGGLTPDPRTLCLVSGEGLRLFPDVRWGALAPAAEHFQISTVAGALGADVLRTGFEDTIHLPDGEVAGTNARLVEALVKIVRTLGREIATPAEAREILSLA